MDQTRAARSYPNSRTARCRRERKAQGPEGYGGSDAADAVPAAMRPRVASGCAMPRRPLKLGAPTDL
eukprot:284157-Chlamydomonas_euryale.AAC.8